MKEKIEAVKGVLVPKRRFKRNELTTVHTIAVKTEHILRPITKLVVMQGYKAVFKVM